MPDQPIIGGADPRSARCAPIDAPYLLSSVDNRLPNASSFPGVILAASSAPTNTRYLWRDTSTAAGVLKYYNGSVWTAFAAVGPVGPAGPGAWSMLTADFTAGGIGSSGLTAVIKAPSAFAPGVYVMIVDSTFAQAFYQVSGAPSLLNPSGIVLTRLNWDTSVASNYVFTVGNGALATLAGYAPGGSVASGLEPVVAGSFDAPELVFAAGDIVMA